ncbi:cilia- and flagella-associated protein 251-like [Centropristis striata]|uniref:cilia- and flagella-associated protein 251-like n=1 Tax=Centropristis striata TaxID=184440 RepID=UPI0027E0CE5A|nr:cilia- and flagella-associated protein 251-like [Centropristis striata]
MEDRVEEGREEQEEPAVEEKVEDRLEEKLEEEQEVPAVEERVEERVEEVEERVNLERGESEEDVFLPIPSVSQRLPRPKQNWEVEYDENWDMAAEYRELRREKEQELEQEQEQEQEQEWTWEGDSSENRETELNEDQKDDDAQSWRDERPLPSVAVTDEMSQRKPFSFLTSTMSVEQLADDESESGGSQSDGSVSAASISGLSLVGAAGAGGRRADVLPGPWLTPSQQRVAQVTEGNRRPGRWSGRGGGRSAISRLFNRK